MGWWLLLIFPGLPIFAFVTAMTWACTEMRPPWILLPRDFIRPHGEVIDLAIASYAKNDPPWVKGYCSDLQIRIKSQWSFDNERSANGLEVGGVAIAVVPRDLRRIRRAARERQRLEKSAEEARAVAGFLTNLETFVQRRRS